MKDGALGSLQKQLECLAMSQVRMKKGKIVQINTVCNTSTGRIMGDIQREAIHQGFEVLSLVGRRKPFPDMPCIKIGNPISFWSHVILTTVFDLHGLGSWIMTKRMVAKLRKESPDIIHLHNIHGYYLNYPVLFRYLKKDYQGAIFWTFHDCWPFTGHCAYFTMTGCEKWKTGCGGCPNRYRYPISLGRDASAKNYLRKKDLFCGLKNLTVLVPSQWMQELANQSFFHEYPIRVVRNGIDISLFSYSLGQETYRKYNIKAGKKVLLGVANVWDQRKGLQDLIKLAIYLEPEYQMVLVGLSLRQLRKLPRGIIGIQRTENQRELVELYSRAEIFINPSREESFSLVTLEALACGTPVIVLGNSAVGELVTSANGVVLDSHEPLDYFQAIQKIENTKMERNLVRRTVEKYDKRFMTEKIMALYREVLPKEVRKGGIGETSDCSCQF